MAQAVQLGSAVQEALYPLPVCNPLLPSPSASGSKGNYLLFVPCSLLIPLYLLPGLQQGNPLPCHVKVLCKSLAGLLQSSGQSSLLAPVRMWMQDNPHELCAVLQIVCATSCFMPVALRRIVLHTSWTLPQGAPMQLVTLLYLRHNLAFTNLADFCYF